MGKPEQIFVFYFSMLFLVLLFVYNCNGMDDFQNYLDIRMFMSDSSNQHLRPLWSVLIFPTIDKEVAISLTRNKSLKVSRYSRTIVLKWL